MASQTPRPVLVCGMHRSGTSAMAGALTAMGCYAGPRDSLLPANDHNRHGYFERHDVVACNEALLSARAQTLRPELASCNCFSDLDSLDGYGWVFGAWGMDGDAGNRPSGESAPVERCIRSLRKHAPPGAPLLIKDPRLSLALPTWLAGLPDPVIILMIRDPAAAAASLLKREGILPDVSFALWRRYTVSAARGMASTPLLVVDYDHLVDEPAANMRRVAGFIADERWKPDASAIEAAGVSISSGLRHQATPPVVGSDPLLNECYRELRETGCNTNVLEKLDSRNDTREWTKALYLPALARLNAAETELRQLRPLHTELLRYRAQMARLNDHPVAGPVIRLVRWIKRDPTFGGHPALAVRQGPDGG